MKTFFRWVCLALAFIWLWGCSSEQPGPPEKISTLIIGTGRDATQPGNFQPFGMWEPACLIYETLVNLDTETEPVPCLAKSWQVSNDGCPVSAQAVRPTGYCPWPYMSWANLESH